MHRPVLTILGTSAALLVGAGVSSSPAQIVSTPSQSAPIVSEAPASKPADEIPTCVIPVDLDDPPFARHVDLILFGIAWDNQDPALLTDLGLQLMEGERVLFRPHKAIKSQQVLELAANLAADRHDRATLARLTRVAEQRNDGPLGRLLSQLTEKAPQESDHPIAHAIEDLTPASLQAHQALIRRIRAARYAGSQEGLDKLDKYSDRLSYLHPAQQSHIDKEIKKARANIKGKTSMHDLVVILDRLAAITPCRR